ncbi:MAG: DNA cytosine methyltransferase [Bacteroidota bacterium]|nr:DNA cytosine methyltransferase [Bacteroidota bacterium]
MANKKIPILSFFSGGGFLDMGFEMAGFNVVWTNENNETFANMHAAGITSWRAARGNNAKAEIFNTCSIEDITPEQILAEAFKNKLPEKFGVIGGPPCQDFSTGGSNAGMEGERGKLTKLFFRYILKMSPHFFVFENVRNLFNNNKHKVALEKILKIVKKQYIIDHKILNAMIAGVPQDRDRLFIIGIKKTGLPPEKRKKGVSKFSWPKNKKYENARTAYKWPTKSRFKGSPSIPQKIPAELYVNGCLLGKREEATIPNGKEYFKAYAEQIWTIEEGNTRKRSFKRLHRYRYSPTACYGNNEVHLHPFLPRRLSVREALRIQSVEDTYILPADITMTQKFQMIGNGVPVKLAYAVAKTVKNAVNQNNKNLR